MAKTTPEKLEALTFEQAFAQLGQIVDALDSEAVPLEDLVVQYERGMQLLGVCQGRLETARQRVEMIQTKHQATRETGEARPASQQDSRDDLRLL